MVWYVSNHVHTLQIRVDFAYQPVHLYSFTIKLINKHIVKQHVQLETGYKLVLMEHQKYIYVLQLVPQVHIKKILLILMVIISVLQHVRVANLYRIILN